MLENRRFPDYFPWLLVLLIFVVSFIVYFVGLNRYQAPPGCDYGNYLTQVEILRGNDLRGWGLRHNPVFFVMLDIFLRFFEEFTALKIVSSLLFSVIALPFFLLVRKFSKDDLVSVFCTWIFVLFLSNSEMISWGGNPNILGFSFMILTLYFFVDLMNEQSKKNLILTSFFLSLVIGVHILVAVGLIFAVLIYFIVTTWANKGVNKVQFKKLILMVLVSIVFATPYIPFYLNFLSKSSSGLADFSLFSIQVPEITIDGIFATFGFWPIFILFVELGLGLFALSKYIKKENKNNGILLGSIFLSPLILALITEHPIRWAYFIPIPLTIIFGFYIKDLSFEIKNSPKIIRLLAIGFIAIIAVQTTSMAVYHFYNATNVYQFIYDDEIETLEWIKNNTPQNATLATSGHPKGDIGGGGNSYSWWVEGYATRVCIPSGNLQYYSYQAERNQVRVANRIFAGTYSAEYDNLRVSEGSPSNTSNPIISAFAEYDYQKVLTVDDSLNRLFFTQNDNEDEISVIPFYSENKDSIIEYDDNWANITVVYDNPNFELFRSIIMGEEESSADIIFQILPKNSSLNLFKINLWTLRENDLENCDLDENSTASISELLPNDGLAQIKILETNGRIESSEISFDNRTRITMPVISYSFEPVQDSLYVHLRIFIENTADEEDNVQSLQLYRSYDLIEDLGIDYIFLNKNRIEEYWRFYLDKEHFQAVFQNYDTVIFKVS